MLASIHPLGERVRHNRWWLTVSVYLVASLVGGAALGGLAGLLGALTLSSWDAPPLLVSGLGALGGLVALGWDARIGRSLGWRRQVNEDWLSTHRGTVYAAGFGAQLGAGVVTIVTTATFPLAVLLAVLSGHVWSGTLTGAAFGVARGMPVLLLHRVDSPAALRRFHVRMQEQAAAARAAAMGAAGLGAAIVASGALW